MILYGIEKKQSWVLDNWLPRTDQEEFCNFNKVHDTFDGKAPFHVLKCTLETIEND